MPENIARPLKEDELRKVTTCAVCSRKIGETSVPIFYVVQIDRHMVNLPAVQRQSGLEMMIGSIGIAKALGPDEDMTIPLERTTVMVCQDCALKDVVIAVLAEKKGDSEEEQGHE